MLSGIRTHIILPGKEIFRCPRCWIESVRHRPLTRYGITLPDPKGEYYRSIEKGAAVEIRLGYRNEAPAIWKGSVSRIRSGLTKDQIEVVVVGVEAPLTETIITQAFENETPETIIKWAIGQAGMTPGRIDVPGVVFPRFVASSIPVWQVARQCATVCSRAFGMDMTRWALWMDASGAVNWGDFEEDGEVPVIATAEGLIAHLPDKNASGLNRVETFLLSGFRHSRLFRLKDWRREIDDTFRALRVRNEVTTTRARTHIWYGEETFEL